ncbi:MAG: GLPGLI family protein [Bacteroidaceae bacterium]|nr:GLPGLI family protein [Bacteroidaceae bacterium]
MVKNSIIILFIAFSTVCSGAGAQQKQGNASTPISRNLGKGTVVDQTRLRVWYALNADSIGDPDTYIDLQCLDVGDSITKYYSWFVSNSDSLRADYSKRNPRAQSLPLWLGPGGKNKDHWLQYEYSDFYISRGILTEYACMPMHLGRYNGWYTEDYPQMKWTIESKFQIILGYDCQQATCHWRGRDYVAWFAPEIPVRMGPWKLGGLPGLILKAHDADTLYTFEAVKIEKRRYPITRYAYDGYTKTPRTELQKNQRAFAENWFKAVDFRRGSMNPDGSMELGEPLSVHTDYYPLELE